MTQKAPYEEPSYDLAALTSNPACAKPLETYLPAGRRKAPPRKRNATVREDFGLKALTANQVKERKLEVRSQKVGALMRYYAAQGFAADRIAELTGCAIEAAERVVREASR